MRILLVSEFVPPVRGGLEMHVSTLAANLSARGHDVRIASLTREPTPQSVEIYSLAGAAHLLPHEDPQRPFHLPVPDPVTGAQLRRIVEDFDPDVIHAHNWLASSTRWPPWRRRTVPLVLTLHDYALICSLRTLFDADSRICSGPRPGKCLRCSARMMGPIRALALVPTTVAGRKLLAPEAVVAVSSAVRDAVQPYLATPIDVVSNFAAPESDAAPLPEDFPAGPFVLYAGDARAHKGIDDLLAAWTTQSMTGRTLVIASTRPLAFAVPDGVFTTSLSPAQMATAWRKALVGVVPSRWADPCPTVVLEAFRAGTPVVVTAVGGLQHLVQNEVTGLVVPANHPPALGTALERVLTDNGLRQRLARGAALAGRHYDVDNAVDKLVAIYDRVRAPVGAQR